MTAKEQLESRRGSLLPGPFVSLFPFPFDRPANHPGLSPVIVSVRGQKGSGGRGLQQTEETMKLITRFELASRSTNELHMLYRDTFNALCSCKPHSAEQRTCLASLQSLEDEIDSRSLAP